MSDMKFTAPITMDVLRDYRPVSSRSLKDRIWDIAYYMESLDNLDDAAFLRGIGAWIANPCTECGRPIERKS